MHDLVLGNGDLQGGLLDLDLLLPGGADIFNADNQYLYGSVLDSVYSKANKGMYVVLQKPAAAP